MCQHCAHRWGVMISVYRKRHDDLVHFFKMERGLVACTDIDGLMQTLNINHNPLDWRLFIDSSKLSLKAVLHNGNTLPSTPVGHSVHNKESYENMKILMEAINYDKFKWQICGDLKVIALLLRLQRFYKILLLHLWMGQQSSVSSLLKKGLACQKISGTRNHERGSTTSGTE